MFELTRPDLQEPVSGLLRRQVQGGIAADHLARILCGLGTQRHPERDVGLGFLNEDRSRRCPPSMKNTLQPRPSCPMWMIRSIHSDVVEQLQVLVDHHQQDRYGFQIAAGESISSYSFASRAPAELNSR